MVKKKAKKKKKKKSLRKYPWTNKLLWYIYFFSGRGGGIAFKECLIKIYVSQRNSSYKYITRIYCTIYSILVSKLSGNNFMRWS